eukprot:CAMPEP_0176493828 /NCGR_PEP_ID=MMETSP0200_2-20121128/9752_1 /TAXON_ID=947934 /ORGANISM="Chaetoceros sp., Strain GSL56" /LENGTH=148 /DNA_ID=CAMNT_0017891507 /DNA_START=17 /DNA_END=463 /DNA_ORIENTATION=-
MNFVPSIRSIQTTRRTVRLQSAFPSNLTRRYKRTSGNGGTTTVPKKSLSEALKKQNQQTNEAIFGLRPVDFTIIPPLYKSPPPPPPKPGLQKYLFPFTVALSAGIAIYFYLNNSNDSKEYWEAMQTGGVLPGTYDDDDDDDDEDDAEE